jgi:hypothetical protein
MSARHLPVIYVRGFAGTSSGIDKAVDDPLHGFNLGSVHVRVGSDARPHFYQFEGPLLRMLHDREYRIPVHGNQRAYLESQKDKEVPWETVWVHRFYDRSASTFGAEAEEFDLEAAAKDLFELVQLVRRKTDAGRVFLVAHSMGGLICRSLIQKVIPEKNGNPTDYVDRLFTYGTPHGGIHFSVGGGLLERFRDRFDIGDAAIFGPDRMFQYLTPGASKGAEAPAGWSPAEIPENVFPKERVFCLVGTNPEDYEAALGLSAKAVGPRSDGLVQIEHAYVPGANRAFVHRSHSGRYGLVNSEEGYQNLSRFLFGDLRVRVDLVRLELEGDRNLTWQLDVQLAIRGLPILIHEQTAAHHCPIQLEWPKEGGQSERQQPLLTTFLSSSAPTPDNTGRLRYALHLRLMSAAEHEDGSFNASGHLEQMADFDDTLVVDVHPGDGGRARVWAEWNSKIDGAVREWTSPDQDAKTWRSEIPVPDTAHRVLGTGAAIRLVITPWH